ncbi:unnamed protein product [Miscanthus lutarioriparius]|uniref:Cation/H(+) antiporter C-terminal domain-containing protein n=1 Tax=Miscanthus lutarioriparius TaxID=422564 RepID=A0A811Q2Y8_9POAL|nr:unnamed protein product [Miscanthus lutarioriparius]
MAAAVWMAVNLLGVWWRACSTAQAGGDTSSTSRQDLVVDHTFWRMLLLVVGLSMLKKADHGLLTPPMTAFLIGLAMPREGPTRTLMEDHRLAYPCTSSSCHCAGAIGARLDFAKIGNFTVVQLIVAVTFTTLLSTAGKVAGTVLAGRALGIATREAVVLGALLNVKGYSDILAINFGNKINVWGETMQVVLLISSIINTFMAGPASAAIVRQQRRASGYRSRCLEDLSVDHELRMLVCIHGATSVYSMLTLSDLSKGRAPVAVYLLHLVELVTSHKYAITQQLYHARDGGQDEDEWGYAREIEQVASTVATFTYDNAILILHRAPCTVGILVGIVFANEVTERIIGGGVVLAVLMRRRCHMQYYIVAADGGECNHRCDVVCRFLLPSGRGLSGNPKVMEEAMEDEEFMADLYARFVAPGHVSYMEKYVSNGAETVNTLSSMVGTCSLFIVGKGDRAHGSRGMMTSDMGDWDEECQELGPIGELLSSDDLVGCGSVLVLQQHNKHKMKTWNKGNQQQQCHQAQDHQASVVDADAVVDIIGSFSSTSSSSYYSQQAN